MERCFSLLRYPSLSLGSRVCPRGGPKVQVVRALVEIFVSHVEGFVIEVTLFLDRIGTMSVASDRFA